MLSGSQACPCHYGRTGLFVDFFFFKKATASGLPIPMVIMEISNLEAEIFRKGLIWRGIPEIVAIQSTDSATLSLLVSFVHRQFKEIEHHFSL